MVYDFVKNDRMLTQHRASSIAHAVIQGLSQTPKRLPSWLLYDPQGDRIFQSIMHMPEYYPTRCEYSILQEKKAAMRHHFTAGGPFQLVEFGAGDGWKTEVLLRELVQAKASFTYVPVDISAHVLDLLAKRLEQSLPGLPIIPVNEQNEHVMAYLPEKPQRKIFLFLGANIGNYEPEEAIAFGKKMAHDMQDHDLLMIGFDLKKDPTLIRAAYDDPKGITRDFNLNLLTRLNRELGANFNPAQFQHAPVYDPQTGAARSYLVSRTAQSVTLLGLGQTIHFNAWETIHTEISMKYDNTMIRSFADSAGLEIVESFYDHKKYFCDVLFRIARS